MAQYRLDNQEIGQPGNRYEITMVGTIDGNVVTTHNPFPIIQVGATAVSAFGEPYSVTPTPIIQADAVYGLHPRVFETLTANGGSASTNNSVISISSGSNIGSYAVVRTKEYLRYRAGQGALARFTAGFPTPNTYTTQRAGFTSQEQSIMVGYDGDNFGVVRMNGGKSNIRLLTITHGADSTETATLTLNGVAHTITLSSGNTVQTAAQIASSSLPVWLAESVDSSVKLACMSNGPKTGAFSFTSTGTTTGTFSVIQSGVADVANWTYQSDFNVDKLDGTGDTATNPSGMTINPGYINVYQINYRWLGVGEIRYAVEHPDTGQMVFFHKEHYTGRNLTPHLDNPSMRLGYIAANKSDTICANTTTIGICVMGAIEGLAAAKGYPFSAVSGDLSSLASGTAHHLMTIRNALIFQDHFNLKVIRLKRISVALQGTDPVELHVLLSPTYSARQMWDAVNAAQSCALRSVTTSTFTLANEVPIYTMIIPINDGGTFDLQDLDIQIPANTNLAFTAKSGKSISTINLAVTWDEI